MPAEMEAITSIDSASILPKKAEVDPNAPKPFGGFDKIKVTELFEEFKKESFNGRWVFERQWLRNIYYVLDRQWIRYNSKNGEWQDKRLAKWIPRPTNPDLKNGVQSIRAMLTSVKIGVNARPNGQDPENMATAALSDDLAPVLHEEHHMNAVMNEGDWWFIVTGNQFLYTYMDYDAVHGVTEVPVEVCVACGNEYDAPEIHEAGQKCPDCGGMDFMPALDDTGEAKIKSEPKGKAVTRALSPLEIAFPNNHPRFEDVPGVILMRWRTKSYYDQHPEYGRQVVGFKWQKSPNERSMQIFKMMPSMNDLGMNPFIWSGGQGESEEEGAPEFELWIKPCGDYPKGLVARFLGDDKPLLLDCVAEGLPGPLPYTTASGEPLWTIAHAAYEHVGGRILGSSAIDPAIGKLDQLNQHDSMVQMNQQRMANPIWLKPKGSETSQLTGETGLVVEWNPLTSNGAEPKRLDGVGMPASSFTLREQYKHDIEEALGTYDIVKGAKPTGVEAFTALQLLVERSQSRFASTFQARGDMYRAWFSSALELERQFGPDERTQAVLSPARKWTFKTFKRANLRGSVTIVVEDGSTAPKTSLGIRAAVEHLNQLGAIDMADPDQRYEVLRRFGQTSLIPSLDIHMQRALRKQQEFEEWLGDPDAMNASMQAMQTAIGEYQQTVAAIPPPDPVIKPEAPAPKLDGKGGITPQESAQPTQQPPMPQLPPPPSPNTGNPLEWMPWWKADVHKQEFMKWANSDKIVDLLKQNPAVKGLLIAHLADIDMALMQQMAMAQGPPKPGGAGMAMANSGQESGSTTNAGGGGGVPAGQV